MFNGYPNYPPNGAYPPPNGAYPPPGAGYPPPQMGGYPPQGYPPPQGYQTKDGNQQQNFSQPPYGGFPPPQAAGSFNPYSPTQGGYPPQGYPPQGYPPQGYPPQGYAPQGGFPQQGASLLTPAECDAAVKELRDSMKGFGTNEKKLINVIGKYPPAQMNQIINGYKSNYGKDLLDDVRNETSGNFGDLCCALCMPIVDYDVKCLHDAVDRTGTDDDCLMEILVGRTNSDIRNLCNRYSSTYGRRLEDDIKGDTSGYVRRLYTVLLQGNRDETNNNRDVNADVEALYRAGEGRMGTDEMAFISMLCNRPDSHLRQVFDLYQQKHGHTIEKAIKKEFSGDIEDALLDLVASIRNKAEYIAVLFEKSMKGIGTDDEKLIRLVVRHRAPHVIEPIKQAYRTKYGKSLAKRIKGETSGDYEKLLIACINGEKDL